MDFNRYSYTLILAFFITGILGSWMVLNDSGSQNPPIQVEQGNGTYYQQNESENVNKDENQITDNSSESNESSQNADSPSKKRSASNYRNVVRNDFDSVKLLRDSQPVPGQSNILEVKNDGSLVEDAEVYIQGDLKGLTEEEGIYFFGTPDSQEFKLSVQKDGMKAEIIYEQQQQQ